MSVATRSLAIVRPSTPPPGTAAQARAFRPDIEGLRAVAILLVVGYHANLLGIHGGYVGVDVFFVLSGFLITRQLVAGITAHGRRELPAFYARRIRRLLPASTVVVVTTVLAAHLWAPALLAKNVATDAVVTTFYGLNYRLAMAGTDYLHQGDAVSPLQHFWSLGVEEQFYLAWPLLILAVTALPARSRRTILAGLLLAIAAASFYRSATTTVDDPAWAYFSLATRAWELAAGGLVAVTAQLWAQMPRWTSDPLAWAGLSAVAATGWLFNDTTVYPGMWAAVPVAGTAIVLAAGCAPRRHGVERLLGEPVLQGIGKISYGWYLWHWPFLILAPYIARHPLEWPRRIEVVLLSLFLAILSYHIVENPVRRMRRPDLAWVQTALVMAGVVAAVAVISSDTVVTNGQGLAAQAVPIDVAKPGLVARMATTLDNGVTLHQAPRNMTPTLAGAQTDLPSSRKAGCLGSFTDPVTQPACVYGDPAGTRTAVMFGDSHMEQYEPGLAIAATKAHWRLVVWTRSACPAAQVTVYAPALKRTYTECDQWRTATITKIQQMRPDLVLISQSDDAPGADLPDQAWAQGIKDTIGGLHHLKIPVTFLQDTPFPNADIPGCIADHLTDVTACTPAVAHVYDHPSRRAAAAQAAAAAGAGVVDPIGWICGAARCPVIVGNIIVWRDTGHITATYSRWLAPVLASLLPARRVLAHTGA